MHTDCQCRYYSIGLETCLQRMVYTYLHFVQNIITIKSKMSFFMGFIANAIITVLYVLQFEPSILLNGPCTKRTLHSYVNEQIAP